MYYQVNCNVLIIFATSWRNVIRKGEFPSGNVHASARGLAKLASSMANKGKMLDGSSIISEDTWNLMHSNSTLKFDAGLSKLEIT